MTHAPLAIVGIGCRFPGGIHDRMAFWRVVLGGIDAVGEVPPERWNLDAFYSARPRRGRSHTRWAGFVTQPFDELDAAFFGISPREAAHLSPMQRWLMESCWEALEDAGIPPTAIAGSDAGVFVGGFVEDALTLAHAESNRELLDAHTGTGVATTLLSNRLSYLLDLHGPSVTVDTACSSSLVAVHMACQAVWSGQCSIALVGGANAIFHPGFNIAASQANMLSPTGRSRAFDARADGYTRGEGAAIVVIEPLDRALAEGHPVYACIRATGVNQDGRTNGITVPNADAQAGLMREVYVRAGVVPGQIAYVEAHGTGTAVGDPLEMKALDAVLSQGRAPDDRCPVGSVKTNIGHTEGAAGIAGLIKAALVLRHGTVPPNLHFETPNPAIPWDRICTRVPVRPEPLVRRGEIALAGVNSFGFGGTNAHVLLEEPPAMRALAAPPSDEASGPQVFPLSAKSPEALAALADRYAGWIDDAASDRSLRSLSSALAHRRAHLTHRAAIVAASREDLRRELALLARGEASKQRSEGRAAAAPAIAFVYTGMGPQWWAMGQTLYRAEPVFRATVDACDAVFRRIAGWSIRDEMLADEPRSRMARTEVAQPANFVIQAGITEMLRAWGVEPAAIVGHSVGEVAAAWAAGALDLEQAVRVSFHRSRVQQKAAGLGTMLAASLGPEDAADLVRSYEGRVSVAVVNSPSSVTLAGEAGALREMEAALGARGVFCKMLRVEVAYHSHQMDPLREEILASLAGIAPAATSTPLYSTVTADRVEGSSLDARYWWRNVRETVRMADAAGRMIADGLFTFVQIGPHPVLAASLRECLDARGLRGEVVATLHREAPEREALLGTVGKLWALGVPLSWGARLPVEPAFPMPTYPWQRQRHWAESEDSRLHRLGAPVHPLLGRRVGAPLPTWECDLGDRHEWLADHQVQGAVVFPAAGYLEMALAAAREQHGGSALSIEDVSFRKALFLPDVTASVKIRLVLEPESGRFDVFSATNGQRPWVLHASGTIRALAPEASAPVRSLSRIRRRAPSAFDRWGGSGWAPRSVPSASSGNAAQPLAPPCPPEHDALYAALGRAGLSYGPVFRTIADARRGEADVVATLRTEEPVDGFVVHPALLDGGFQALVGLALAGDRPAGVFLPVHIARLTVYAPTGTRVTAHGRVAEIGPGAVTGDLDLIGRDGEVFAEIRGLRAQSLAGAEDVEAKLRQAAYVWRWEADPARVATSAARLGPGEIVAAAQPRVDAIAAAVRHAERVRAGNDAMNGLALSYVVEAFDVLGFALDPGATFTTELLAARLRVVPAQRRLFASLVEILAEEGAVRPEGEGYRVLARPAVRPSADLFRDLFFAYPDYASELQLLHRCGSNLPAVLWGRVQPLSLVFPKDALTSEHLYQDSPSLRLNNLMAREAVAALVAALPAGRKLRVLEVGAGTGGTATHVLPALSEHTARYVYTDVTGTFTARAREKFRQYPFVEYRTFDVSQDPASQGFDAGAFDLIIAANVLHATPDVRRSLAHIAALLAPGGLLALIEITKLPRMVKLTFGQLRDWWSFTDREMRAGSPCLPFEGWTRALEATGFDDVTRFHDAAGEENSLILARRGGARAPSPALAPEGASSFAGKWIIVSDRTVGPALASALAARGAEPVLVDAGASPEALRAAVAGTNTRGMIHLGALDAASTELLDRACFDGSQRRGTYSALAALQALASARDDAPVAVWLVTRGAQAVGAARETLSLAQAPLWGLGRVAINEHPDVPVTLVDLDPAGDAVAALIDEIAHRGSEHEVAWRGGTRFVQRLCAAPWGDPAGEVEAFVVEDGTAVLRASRRREPGPGEVEVAVEAAGLSGGEIAGRVTVVGEGVSRWAVGDAVLGFGDGALGSHAVVPASALAPLPRGLDPEAAATLPLAFLALHVALGPADRARPGERVLIHGATSALGLLAIDEVARRGGEPIAVADTPTARDLLRALGVERVIDGRLPHFADEVREQTGGSGADVAIHAGDGAALAECARAVRPSGRLVHAGAGAPPAMIALARLLVERGITFVPMDPLALPRACPEQAAAALSALRERLEAGTIRPVPYRVCPVTDVANARLPDQRACSVGATVVAIAHPRAQIAPIWDDAPACRADATYLITGGLSGVGLLTAEWLARRGARHLVLVGRSGASTPAAAEAVDRLRAAGVEVHVARVDVSDAAQLSDLFTFIDGSLPPLRGVLHGAMVLDDGFITQLTPARFDQVLGPKAIGAWNLHVLTRRLPLDFFVLYSSIASVGLRGQANYVAANVFLDQLAHERRARGLPALSINWGVIADVGYVSRNAQLYGYFDQQGMRALSPAEVESALGYHLTRPLPQAFVFPVDWAMLSAFAPEMTRSPRFSHLVSAAVPRGGSAGAAPDAALLSQIQKCADRDERARLVADFITGQVAGVLGLSPSQVDRERPVTELGLDSMMAIELSGRLQASLRVNVPVARLLQGSSILHLTQMVP